ncbi:MAG TPA: hypothetical protein VLA02_15190 [Reyranella sp.]|nr:hypothetical protein [Reyranella sp.]
MGPEERLPPARDRPRRGALEGRRARGCRDRAPAARRCAGARPAGGHRRGAGEAGRGRPAGDPAGQRYLHRRRGAAPGDRRRDRLHRVRRRSQPTPAPGRPARRHAVRGGGRRRRGGALAAAGQDHRPEGQGGRYGEPRPAAAGARGDEDGAHPLRPG